MSPLQAASALILLALLAAGCASGTRTGGSTQSGRSALVGAWHESFTRAEYVRAGADAGEAADSGNWGAFVLTLGADGRYILARPNEQLGMPTGTYRVSGNTLSFKCTCDINTWRYRWSVYRGQLSLHRVTPTSGGPTGFIVKPWLRGS